MSPATLHQVVMFRGEEYIAVPLIMRTSTKHTACYGCAFDGKCHYPETSVRAELPSCVENDVIWKHATPELKVAAVTAKLTGNAESRHE